MIVLAIDPGIVNTGFAAYDTDRKKFLFYDHVKILDNERQLKSRQNLYDIYKVKLFDRFKDLFRVADIVLVEHQMRQREILIETNLVMNLRVMGKQHKVISAMSIKRMFGSSCNDHGFNKSAAKEIIKYLLPGSMDTVSSDKQDDVSDAMLMCMYWGNQLDGIKTVKHGLVFKKAPPKPRKKPKSKVRKYGKTSTKRTTKKIFKK